jgi:hypothetical protein
MGAKSSKLSSSQTAVSKPAGSVPPTAILNKKIKSTIKDSKKNENPNKKINKIESNNLLKHQNKKKKKHNETTLSHLGKK